MAFNYQKLNRTLVVIGISAFVLMGFLALFDFGMSMNMNGYDDMSHCPFMSVTSVCGSSPLDHISAWHGVFSNILNETGFLTTILFACIAIYFFVLTFFKLPQGQTFNRPPLTQYRWSDPEPVLQKVYSNGILNPKLF